jgi:UPF0755 protein
MIAAAALTFVATAFIVWLGIARPGAGRAAEVEWPSDGDRSTGVSRLVAAGVIESPLSFRVLLAITRPFLTPAPGPHLLPDNLTPAEVLRRLCRLSSRARTRLVVPEGFSRFQIATRLEEQRVCSGRAFAAAATDAVALARLGIRGDSAEGYLFPATYDLFADSAGEAVVAELVAETNKRFAAVSAKHAPDLARLAQKYGWDARSILTLASVVEKETGRPEEQPLIASVFFNRLDDPTFRPARTLQSDPTAGYGCLVSPALESCRGYAGHVTPAMLRDSSNPYNTYRHPGLPPGPIANPGLRSVEAVLTPAATDYLFFVRSIDGRHVFTKTFEEHEAAIGRK